MIFNNVERIHADLFEQSYCLQLITRTRSPAEMIAELNRYEELQRERRLQQRTNPRVRIPDRISFAVL